MRHLGSLQVDLVPEFLALVPSALVPELFESVLVVALAQVPPEFVPGLILVRVPLVPTLLGYLLM